MHGLPLQLSPEEVTLCLARGWAELYSVDTAAARAAPFPSPPAVCKKEKEKKPLPAKGWGARPALPHEKKRQKTKSDRENEETPWTAVLRTPNKRVDTPYVHERDGEVCDGGNQTKESLWSFPRTDSQRRRCAVFAHMHARGVTLTSGAKFGAEYLAYPGDPAAYHAAFTVRVMDGEDDDDLQKQKKRKSESDDEEEERDDARFVSLLSLVAATRMSHGARKHCVLAGARRVEGEEKIKAEEESGGLLSEARRAATRALGEWEVSCVTVVPDVEQSSQRRGRVGA